MHSLKQFSARFAAFNLLASLVLLISTSALADITQVSNAELKTLIQKGVPVIDVRRPDEWKKTGIVEGSHLMTFFDAKGQYDVQAWLSELDSIVAKDESFVMICAVGGRTGSITKLLDKKLGYSGVHNVTKGINHWIRSGEATVPWSP